MTTKQVKEIIGAEILSAQSHLFASSEHLKIVYPFNLTKYIPKHPLGEFIITYRSSEFGKSRNAGSVVQDKDITISVFTVVKFRENWKAPEDYTDFLESALSGLKLNTNRKDKMIFPASVKFLKEESGYWWYESMFLCPVVNIQENHL